MSVPTSPTSTTSTLPDDPHVLAGEYVLGTLPAATRSAVAKRLQTDVVLLARLASAGVVPGGTVVLTATGQDVAVTADGKDTVLELPVEVSRHIFVGS